MVHLEDNMPSDQPQALPPLPDVRIIEGKPYLVMERRDVILTAVLSTLAALITLGVTLFICYWWHKRKRKRDEEDGDQGEKGRSTLRMDTGGSGGSKEGRSNGFLSLKTPLISTKTLG
ncbi:uncharacterized protein [Periplaneta americana]|uniref:uncharacterized protein n=1 Tax=Periplaneta americana TaxID=6978 RepID=UPI0037E9168E